MSIVHILLMAKAIKLVWLRLSNVAAMADNNFICILL